MVETLVVVSKIKALIKKQADMSTSATAIDALTKIVEKECLKAKLQHLAATRPPERNTYRTYSTAGCWKIAGSMKSGRS